MGMWYAECEDAGGEPCNGMVDPSEGQAAETD